MCWDFFFIFCKAFWDSVGGKVLCRCKLVRRSLSLFTCCVCLSLNSISCQPIYPCSLLTINSGKTPACPFSQPLCTSSLPISHAQKHWSHWAACYGSLRGTKPDCALGSIHSVLQGKIQIIFFEVLKCTECDQAKRVPPLQPAFAHPCVFPQQPVRLSAALCSIVVVLLREDN